MGAATVVGLPADFDRNPHRTHNFDASVAPTATDDASKGYSVGSLWMMGTTGDMYRCRAATIGAARWIKIDVQDHPGYVAGRFYATVAASGLTNGVTVSAATAYFGIGLVKQRVTISQLGLKVSTAAAGTFQLGVYALDTASLLPGKLLGKTGNLSSAAAVLVNGTLDAAVTLEPGNYYFAALASSSAVAFQSVGTGGNTLHAATIGSTVAAIPSAAVSLGYSLSMSGGVLVDVDSPGSLAEQTNARIPAMQFLVASVP